MGLHISKIQQLWNRDDLKSKTSVEFNDAVGSGAPGVPCACAHPLLQTRWNGILKLSMWHPQHCLSVDLS